MYTYVIHIMAEEHVCFLISTTSTTRTKEKYIIPTKFSKEKTKINLFTNTYFT